MAPLIYVWCRPPLIFWVLTFIPCFDSTRHACFAGFFLKLRCKKYDSREIHNGSWGLCAIRRRKILSGFLTMAIGNVGFRGDQDFFAKQLRSCHRVYVYYIRWKYRYKTKFLNGCCPKMCNWDVCLEIRYIPCVFEILGASGLGCSTR